MEVANIDGNKKTIIIIFISIGDKCVYFKIVIKNIVIKKKIESIKNLSLLYPFSFFIFS